ncbi:MAG: twin-arginine translocase TatA/TatE family subunit [Flavobacteriales bacterium]|nr:twin-arginine translocase TatA/TatE family subunit [Flavobacteriales bacterium]
MIALLFDISGGELLVVLVFILIFFGAKGIPDIARGMGRFMRQVREASNEVQREIHKGANEIRRTTEEHQRQFLSAVEETPPPHTTAPKPSEPAAKQEGEEA